MFEAEPTDALAATLKRTETLRRTSSIPGRDIIQVRTEIPAGVASGWHTHPGEEVGYIVAGTVRMDPRPGDTHPAPGRWLPDPAPHTAQRHRSRPRHRADALDLHRRDRTTSGNVRALTRVLRTGRARPAPPHRFVSAAAAWPFRHRGAVLHDDPVAVVIAACNSLGTDRTAGPTCAGHEHEHGEVLRAGEPFLRESLCAATVGWTSHRPEAAAGSRRTDHRRRQRLGSPPPAAHPMLTRTCTQHRRRSRRARQPPRHRSHR